MHGRRNVGRWMRSVIATSLLLAVSAGLSGSRPVFAGPRDPGAPVLVLPGPLAEAPPPARSRIHISGLPAAAVVADRIDATIAADRRRFSGATGPVEGFSAGTSYPQIWLRDSATVLP